MTILFNVVIIKSITTKISSCNLTLKRLAQFLYCIINIIAGPMCVAAVVYGLMNYMTNK